MVILPQPRDDPHHACSTRIANAPAPPPTCPRVYAILTRVRVSAANYQDVQRFQRARVGTGEGRRGWGRCRPDVPRGSHRRPPAHTRCGRRLVSGVTRVVYVQDWRAEGINILITIYSRSLSSLSRTIAFCVTRASSQSTGLWPESCSVQVRWDGGGTPKACA
jgi:hypothetical protein